MNFKKIMQFAIGPLGAAILSFVTLPIVTWLFSPEDVGRLSMLQVVISFSLLLFSLGLDQAYVREFHEAENKASLFKSAIFPGFIILILVMFILVQLPFSISKIIFGIESSLLTLLLFTCVLLAFNSRFLSLILRMQERAIAFSMSQLLSKLIFLLLIGSYVIFSVESIFINLVLAHVVSLIVVFIVFSWNTRADWRESLISNVDPKKVKKMIHFGVPLIFGGLAFWGMTATDKIFLRTLSSFKELGLYSVSISFAGAALVFQSVFSTVWAPIVYKWASDKVEPTKIQNILDYVTLSIIAIWSVAGMLSSLVRYLLPNEYENVQYILLAAMAYPLLYTLSEVTGIGIGIKRKSIFSMFASILALVTNVICNYILIPKYGASGAAIASAFSFMIFFIVRTEASSYLWFSFKRSKMYFLISFCLLLSFWINLNYVSDFHIIISWFSVLAFSLFIYRIQVFNIYFKLKSKLYEEY